MKEYCNKCEKETYIVNRKRMLCDDCNHYRLHGETKQETLYKQNQKYQLKQQSKPIKIKVSKPIPIKNLSKKEAIQKQHLSYVKQEIRKEAFDSDNYYCWGCGVGGEDLDCSHILSVKHRKDLELEKENINLFCRKCHEWWESGDVLKMISLNTFVKDFEYIKSNDLQKFYKLQSKIQEYNFIEQELTLSQKNTLIFLKVKQLI